MIILSGLTSGQVLQRLGSRGGAVRLQGTCAEDGPIRVTLSKGKTILKGWRGRLAGKIAHGKFRIKLTSIPVGGPYALRLEAGEQRVHVAPFFVGDVWILAGQSNMEGVGNMTRPAKRHPLIRAFSMRREWRPAEDPLHILAESPDACHSSVQCTVRNGEALRRKAVKGVGVGLFFAREMLKRSGGVPQGLICTAHGGTSMQQWSPAWKHLGGQSLYASMLASVQATGQPVSGMLWYQGEGDTNSKDAPRYTPRMKRLVEASRRNLRQSRLPWLTVQIARLFSDQSNPQWWNSIQEQQRLLPKRIRFFETVPAIDLPVDDLVHVGSEGFPRLATRLASAADRMVYGNKREILSPQLHRVRPINSHPYFSMEVTFSHVQGELRSEGQPEGFKFTSPEGTPLDLIYKTELKGTKVRLHLARKPPAGIKLFHGHGFAPICNIADSRGFSLPVFGPYAVDRVKPKALTPFITQWTVTDVIPVSKKLDQLPVPEMDTFARSVKNYPEGFINEHENWESKTGQAFFHSRLQLSESMRLEFLMGYDGPFRLWLDEKPFFTNMKGTNPCLPDMSSKATSLEAGVHDVHVGMDLNDGGAWGFFLRMARKDVALEEILTQNFVKPDCFV